MLKPTTASISPVKMLSLPIAMTCFCWYFSPNQITALPASLTFLLLFIPWSAYLRWREKQRRDFPLFAMLAFMHWIYFAQPYFWGIVDVPGLDSRSSAELLTITLAMAVLGLTGLWLGMRTPILLFNPKKLPDLTDGPLSWPYLRLVMIGGILIGLRTTSAYALGEDGRQIMTLLQTVLPLSVFAFFFRKYVLGTAAPADKILILMFLASRIVVGLTSGWLATIIWPGAVCALIYVTEGRRIPVFTASSVVVCILFLQVGKADFREVYWGGQTEGTMTERLQFWVAQSAERWSDAFNATGRDPSRDLASQTISRLSLLTQAAHVLDWTPERVPFQNGHTYTYMAVTLIPRFLWPDKPSVSEANQFYQVAYGLTAHNELNRVSIAVGFLTEGYINFGWSGVAGVTYCVGLILGLFQRTFLSAEASTLFRSIGLAAIPSFMVLESQLAQYFGGFTQQLVLTLLVLAPVMKSRVTSTSEPEYSAACLDGNVVAHVTGRD